MWRPTSFGSQDSQQRFVILLIQFLKKIWKMLLMIIHIAFAVLLFFVCFLLFFFFKKINIVALVDKNFYSKSKKKVKKKTFFLIGKCIFVYFLFRLQHFQQMSQQILNEEDNFEQESDEETASIASENSSSAPPAIKKPRGRPPKTGKENKNKPKRMWNDEEVRLLIRYWKDEENLYNVKLEKYHDKNEKQKSLKRITLKLQADGLENISEEIVSEKLRGLRSCFGAEKRKEKTSKASGAGTDSVYVSNWRFLHELDFLNDNLVPRKSFSNLNDVNNITPNTSSAKRAEDLARENSLEKTNRVMEIVSQQLLEARRVNETVVPQEPSMSADRDFSNMVCSLLGEINEGEVKDTVKLEIHQLLIKAKYKKSANTHTSYFNDSANNFPHGRNYMQQHSSPVSPNGMQFPMTYN